MRTLVYELINALINEAQASGTDGSVLLLP